MIFNFLPLVVLAAPVFCQNSTTSSNTQETCTTEFAATSPAQVSTTTQVTTTTLVDTERVTSTPSVFINATASTVYQTTILTSTATDTLAQITDTSSSTSTVFETLTISSTAVATVSETITTTVSQSPSTVSVAPSAAKKIKREANTDQCFCIAEGSASGSGSGSAASLFGAGEPSSKYTSTLGSNSGPVQTSTITVTSLYPFTFPIGTSTTYTTMTKPTFTASNSSNVSYAITNGSILASPTQYPSKVYCSELVQITSTSTVTYSAKSTITNYITPPVSTSTVTSTYITTFTLLPVDASVIVTVFSTSTVSSTTIIPSTTTQTITLTATQVSGATSTETDVTTTSTTTTYVPVYTPVEQCTQGSTYTSADGETVFTRYCYTTFFGYEAESSMEASFESCMDSCAENNDKAYGSCVGISYNQSNSICSYKYGILVAGETSSTTVLSARIVDQGGCIDGVTQWGDIFLPSSGHSYTIFCAINDPGYDTDPQCTSAATSTDGCAQECTEANIAGGINGGGGNVQCVGAAFVPHYPATGNCCLKTAIPPSNFATRSYVVDTARLNLQG